MTKAKTEIMWLGRHRIVHEGGQKGLEAAYLLIFKDTKEGKEWLAENNITKMDKSESPDYIFETEGGKSIGLEITNLVIKTDKQQATVALKTIANQICQYFKKEKGIALSMLIAPVSKSWFARTREEIIEATYNPGFSKLEASNKKVKEEIISALSKEEIKPHGMVKTSIKIGSQFFNITATRCDEPHTEATINNEGMCKENPFEELQATINTKNKKFDKYKNSCSACDLLVVSDSKNTGNFAYFSHKIKSHKFESAFRNIYLLDLNSWHDNQQVVKLKKYNIKSKEK